MGRWTVRGWCGVVGEAGCVDMVLWGGVCVVGIEWKGGWMDGGWKGMEARTKP